MPGIVSFLLLLLAFVLICIVVFWLLSKISLPPDQPFQQPLVQTIAAILLLILFLGIVFRWIPPPPFLSF